MREQISFSGGKDSTATVILHHRLGLEPCMVGCLIVMFDNKRGIPAIFPEQAAWIEQIAFPRFRSWGYECQAIRSPEGKDFVSLFSRKITRKLSACPHDRRGQVWGFPLGGACYFSSTGKSRILESAFGGEGAWDKVWLGYAADEPKRLARLAPPKDSLLAKHGITEAMAYDICKSEGLLAPIYEGGQARDGCWFCPNRNIASWKNLAVRYPDLWRELCELRERFKASEVASPYPRHLGDDWPTSWEEFRGAVERMANEERSQLRLF